MPRLFAALSLPVAVTATLSEARGGVPGARWIEPGDYHVTLRFIGDIDADVARDVAEALAGVRRAPFAVEFDGFGSFGGDRPRAIVARIKRYQPLVELQGELERRLRRIGLAPETRNFTPHVTLARLRAASPVAVAHYLGARGGFAAPTFEAEAFSLFSSRDSVGGGPYVVEVDYPLV
ncbi:MAG: RNA 2',3'-cyclic phosphodiesterase [Bradyrhizobium sp.]|nr:MAG: RNA 2',3'-cyclic phosphodiesterase [Bradyrhizobium sp.]